MHSLSYTRPRQISLHVCRISALLTAGSVLPAIKLCRLSVQCQHCFEFELLHYSSRRTSWLADIYVHRCSAALTLSRLWRFERRLSSLTNTTTVPKSMEQKRVHSMRKKMMLKKRLHIVEPKEEKHSMSMASSTTSANGSLAAVANLGLCILPNEVRDLR